ncbi:MAG TPA: hypothetical protein VFD92_13890 [Candidatus Binatia bacterium]|nr:hypothetical protein [Candidatus Binatia bacterium]
MGVDAFTMVAGLGFVLSFGYWCTDFLVVQRAMAADSMSAARRTPLIAAFPKMLFPALVIVPGMVAIALTERAGATGFALPRKPDGTFDYDLTIPLMLTHYFPPGMLGLGLTALLASFMSGMAGNVATRPQRSDDELRGLVYSLTPRPRSQHAAWYENPPRLAVAVLALAVLLNVVFW